MSLLRAALTPAAWLPLGVLYAVSDVAALLLGRVVRYRRRVVRDNLLRAFPDKTDAERRDIERRFYRNFTDNVVETLKLMHISDAQMRRRMEFADTAVIDDLLDSGRSVTVYFAHIFCWEWAPSITLHTRHRPSDKTVYAQIYRPLRSASFDRLMLGLRARFGSRSLPKATALRELLRIRRSGALSVTGFMSDQHPSHGDPGHLTTLLGIPTLMITGTETLARKTGTAAVYWDMERTGRGRYRITTRLMAADAAATAPGELTEMYTRMLEDTIRRDPAQWLWSHKRWKHPVTLSADV